MAISGATFEVCDSAGNLLADGDQVTLVKGFNRQGRGPDAETRNAEQVDPPNWQEIDGKHDGIKGLVLRAEFIRKR